MDYVFIASVALVIGFFLGVLVIRLLQIFDPDEPPGRVAARLVGVSRSPARTERRRG